jgi:cytochrome c biogenesis protein CcdA
MLLVPPVLLKVGSTLWRFARYYGGAPEYRRKGPPPPLLRLLSPVVIVLTVAVFGTGVALMLGPLSWRSELLLLHKASFIAWLAVMSLHVLGHLLDTARLAPRDWLRRTRRQIDGAGTRQWALAASLALGLVLALLVVPKLGPWLVAGIAGHG